MIRTVCINFSLKKSKTLNNGTAPVYLRLTVAGERVEFTTRRYIKPDRWNPDTQKMTGTNEEARVFNHYLKTLEQKVFEEHRVMLDTKVSVTAENLRDRLLGKNDIKCSKMLVPISKEHNKRIKSLIGKEYAAGTLERYETSLKHTIDFMQWQYKRNDIDIVDVDHDDLAELYEVETKQLKRQVRRNIERFPGEDFMFELTNEEYKVLRSQFGTLKQGQHFKYAPMAFTELGISMLSSVLNSPAAIQVNIQIMRIFVHVRQILADNTEIRLEIEKIRNELLNHGKNM